VKFTYDMIDAAGLQDPVPALVSIVFYVCPDPVVVPTDPGVCTTVVYNIDPQPPVGIITYTFSGATTGSGTGSVSGLTFEKGTTTVTYTINDGFGHTITCSFVVIVYDPELPVINCPANISVNTTPGLCSTVVNYTVPFDDNCTGAFLTQLSGLPSGVAYPVGVTTNVFRVTDGSGNTATCSFTVTVTDNQNPGLTCPSNVTKNADPGVCQSVVTIPVPATSDNCGILNLVNSFTGTNNASGTYPVGLTLVTWTATDIHGNTTTCIQTINVVDNQNPSIICPPDITAYTAPNMCTTPVLLNPPTVTDNCGIAGVVNSFNGTVNASGNYPVGVTIVTWVVTDVNGRISTCTNKVTVLDNQNPGLVCPANITAYANAGCQASVVIPTPVVSDNCGIAGIINSFNNTSNASGTYPIGITNVVWTVTDVNGLVSSCTMQVNVIDAMPPSISCPGTISVPSQPGSCSANVSVPGPVASDNCGISNVINTLTGNTNASGIYPIGNTTITWIATDNSGNTSSCSMIVSVYDNQLPTS